MNWNEYLPLAEKTLSTQFHCEEKEQRLLHAVIGILTEVDEILDNYKDGKLTTDINKQGSLGEEICDATWYTSILFREYNIQYDLPKFSEENIQDIDKEGFSTLMTFTRASLKMLDMLKKKLYYNKEIDDKLMIDNSKLILTLLCKYCFLYKINIEESLDRNIAKLKARYHDKFSSDKAINRDLEVEKNILEK